MNSTLPKLIVPNQKLARVYHHMAQGVHAYDEDSLCTPDSNLWKSKVLDLCQPLRPQTAAAPAQYWFDRSRYQNHGTITGAVWKQQPSGVWALSFDGVNGQVTSATSTVLEVTSTTGFAMGGWVNKTAADSNMLLIGISNEPIQSQRMEIWVQRNNASSNFIRIFSSDGGGAVDITAMSASVWHHLFVSQAAEASGNNALIYLDGVLHSSKAVLVYPTWSAGTIKACLGNNANSLPFKGTIGEVSIYNKALTAKQIKQDYLSTRWKYQS